MKISWFPHYIDAMGRDSLKALTNKFNGSGYSVWFCLIEKLCQQLEEDKLHLDCSDPEILAKTAAYCMVSETSFIDIMNYCASINLIDKALWEQKIIWIEQLWENLRSVYARKTFPYAPDRTPPTKEPMKVKTVEEEAFEVAQMMFDFLKRKDPGAKDRRRNWARDIELLHRMDNRPYDYIKKVWLFVEDCDSSAYPYVIKSGQSFREKFEKIVLRMNRTNTKNKFAGVLN